MFLSRLTTGSVLLLSLAGVAGCTSVPGGAVEARWDLRNGLGERITCAAARVRFMAFVLQPMAGGEDPCATGVDCIFTCDRLPGVGTTTFEVLPGEYAMAVNAVGDTGALGPNHGVVSPAPMVRRVEAGQVVDLNVNLIIVSSPPGES